MGAAVAEGADAVVDLALVFAVTVDVTASRDFVAAMVAGEFAPACGLSRLAVACFSASAKGTRASASKCEDFFPMAASMSGAKVAPGAMICAGREA